MGEVLLANDVCRADIALAPNEIGKSGNDGLSAHPIYSQLEDIIKTELINSPENSFLQDFQKLTQAYFSKNILSEPRIVAEKYTAEMIAALSNPLIRNEAIHQKAYLLSENIGCIPVMRTTKEKLQYSTTEFAHAEKAKILMEQIVNPSTRNSILSLQIQIKLHALGQGIEQLRNLEDLQPMAITPDKLWA